FRDLPTGVTLTPAVTADYFHYDADGYTETGAGGAGLRVGAAYADMLDLGIGLRGEWLFRDAGGRIIRPELHTGYKYDVFSGDHIGTRDRFVAGGETFPVNALNPANETFNIGAGVKLYRTTNWNFSAAYDLFLKPDFTAHTAFLRAAYNF